MMNHLHNKLKPSTTNKLKHNAQKGFSLMELLVSITLGAFLLTGVVTNLVGTKNADKTKTAISEMDANARMALGVLRQTILHAGYTSINNVRLETAFYSARDGNLTNPVCSDGSSRDYITPAWNRRTRDGTRDFITVVTLADNPCKSGLATCPNDSDVNPNALVYYDCVGGGAKRDNPRVTSCSTDPSVGMEDPTQAKIYSSFWLKTSGTLYCQGSRGGAQPLVDDIESIQFLYGVKNSNDTVSFRKADSVNNLDLWGNVTSVQVAILIRSSTNILKEDSDKASYNLLDKKVTIPSGKLRRLFRVYTTTINLENRNKGALL